VQDTPEHQTPVSEVPAPAPAEAVADGVRATRRRGKGSKSTGKLEVSTAESPLTGVVGDASAVGTRSGEDSRRRGWFWHWNTTVTQYAPLIGLKGVGLLNSYTVWTDRREESPHRGYAFPSQQSEADFYGEDRAELITINKILVALDLIEIRKEMVLRTDERGRRWKVPHNFYRVKDHGDGFTLTTPDVMRVIELADRDRTVYRYVRRLFSPRFSPIDSQNVWHRILEEVRPTEAWQRLAARTERDESRASARSKAGHASRRASDDTPLFSVPEDGDNTTPEATPSATENDSASVESDDTGTATQTSVALFNTDRTVDDDVANTGFEERTASIVEPINAAQATSVRRSNRTYHQVKTTTTTESSGGDFGSGIAPDASRSETIATRLFEEANARASTPAERRMLRNLAAQFADVAGTHGMTGWHWVALAIDDAVAAGSAFVAPRRVREILNRWERDGVPEEYVDSASSRADDLSRGPREPVTRSGPVSHRAERGSASGSASGGSSTSSGVRDPERDAAPAVFVIDECGMTSRQVWSAVLGELQFSSASSSASASGSSGSSTSLGGAMSRTDVDTWLRDSAIVGRGEDGALVIGVPHEIARRRAAGRYLGELRRAVAQATGVDLGVEVILLRDWGGGGRDDAADPESVSRGA
jgi:hypothetical protein